KLLDARAVADHDARVGCQVAPHLDGGLDRDRSACSHGTTDLGTRVGPNRPGRPERSVDPAPAGQVDLPRDCDVPADVDVAVAGEVAVDEQVGTGAFEGQ